MKRIGIYLGSDRACGGAHQYNRVIVEALIRLPKNEFEIFAIYSADHWGPILQTVGIPSTYCPLPPYTRWLIAAWRRLRLPISLWRMLSPLLHSLARAMKKNTCDLWIFPAQDAFSYWMPVKSLTTIHDLMHRYETRFPEVGSAKEYQWREFHYRQICRYSEGIVVDSELGQQHVIESYKVKKEKCHVLPYIPPLQFTQSSDQRNTISLKLPEKYLFYPAQFWKHKNHANLLKAIAKLKPEIPDLQLVLVGSPKNGFEEVNSLIQDLDLSDCVHLLGLIEDELMPALFRRARALVMPTFFGPTNIPPLEAFASACPVLISGIYGMKAQLGEAALYFDPHSVESLAEAIRRIWTEDDLYRDLVEKGNKKSFEFTIERFSFTLNKILNVELRLCEGL